jgi:Asp-tRNA(Asn)/Glu-tRNA(Gln) amidotransferase A subunit family amidase
MDGAVLVVPATSSVAPPLRLDAAHKNRVRAATRRLACLASLAGLPCVVVPLLKVDGLPAGVALVGAFGSDRALLDLAARVVPAS